MSHGSLPRTHVADTGVAVPTHRQEDACVDVSLELTDP